MTNPAHTIQIGSVTAPWTLHFDRDGTEDYGTIYDANGDKIVTSYNCHTCWLPARKTDEIPGLVYQLRLMTAAPKLLAACIQALAAMEATLETRDAQACTQMEWQAEPLATLRTAIDEAEHGEPV